MDLVHSAGDACPRPRPWHKVSLIRSLFEAGYEFVLWVDADAVVVDPRPDVRDCILPTKHLYLVRHWINGRFVPNTGVMLLRNCDWTRELLRQLWDLEQYADHPWWENAAFLHLFYRDEFAHMDIVNQGELWSQEPLMWISERWNFLSRVSTEGPPVIRHFAGTKYRRRLKRMMLNTHWPHHLYSRVRYRFRPDANAAFPLEHCLDAWTGRLLSQQTARRAA
jgi:hypothetical protein